MTKSQHKHIAILGGTGALGSGLALRWAQAGHHVTLGSRDSERATEVAAKLSQQVSQKITGTSNEKAASRGSSGHRCKHCRPAEVGRADRSPRWCPKCVRSRGHSPLLHRRRW